MQQDTNKKIEDGGREKNKEEHSKKAKTYNTGDSPVVTDLSTGPAVASLSRAERTGCRVF
jgi:hypothetical protein